jgi:general secretion pathway protein G
MQIEKDERRQAGFTLMEIMIVLAIIGLIMGVLVLPRLMGSGEKAKIRAAKTQVSQFMLNYEVWSADNPGESCPGSVDDLVQAKGTGKNARLQKSDPWGTEFRIVCGDSAPDGVGFGVISSGPDKKPDTSDDIKSWDDKKE